MEGESSSAGETSPRFRHTFGRRTPSSRITRSSRTCLSEKTSGMACASRASPPPRGAGAWVQEEQVRERTGREHHEGQRAVGRGGGGGTGLGGAVQTARHKAGTR